MKALIVFDLDGTLAPSKSAIDAEMGTLLEALLAAVKVAIISGGALPQFDQQVIAKLPAGTDLSKLSLLPTNGTRFFQYDKAGIELYAEDLSDAQKQKIIAALQKEVAASGFRRDETWGPTIEDRGSQITYSALGQEAPLDAKKKWDPDFAKRQVIKAALDKSLPGSLFALGGTTSIDVTLPGIDKAYGIRKLRDILGVPIERWSMSAMPYFRAATIIRYEVPARSASKCEIPMRPNASSRLLPLVWMTIKALFAGINGACRKKSRAERFPLNAFRPKLCFGMRSEDHDASRCRPTACRPRLREAMAHEGPPSASRRVQAYRLVKECRAPGRELSRLCFLHFQRRVHAQRPQD